MITNVHITSGAEDEGKRLDKFLTEKFPSATRALLIEAVESGRILVNDRKARKSCRLSAVDSVRVVELSEQADARIKPDPSVKLNIVYEDDSVIILNKPAGIPVHPLHHSETGTLANGLVAARPALAEVGGDRLFPALVHRLDTETSGLILAAKTGEAYNNLRAQFSGRKVRKIYTAVVHGKLIKSGRLENYLAHDPKRRGRMRVMEEKRLQSTDYRLQPAGEKEKIYRAIIDVKAIRKSTDFTLVEVDMKTGITHQIRAQLAHMGNPIVGDKVYGRGEKDKVSRHFLHATRLEFIHPVSGKRLVLESPLPEEFGKYSL